jgi:hypothetical protein
MNKLLESYYLPFFTGPFAVCHYIRSLAKVDFGYRAGNWMRANPYEPLCSANVRKKPA